MARSWFRKWVSRKTPKAAPAGGLARRVTRRRAPPLQKRPEDRRLPDGSANAGQFSNLSSSDSAQAGGQNPIGTIDQSIYDGNDSLPGLLQDDFNYAASYADLPLSNGFRSSPAEVSPASHASVTSTGATPPRPRAPGPESGNLHRPRDLPQVTPGETVAPEDALFGDRRAPPTEIIHLRSRGVLDDLTRIQVGLCRSSILTIFTTPRIRTGPESRLAPERGRRLTDGPGQYVVGTTIPREFPPGTERPPPRAARRPARPLGAPRGRADVAPPRAGTVRLYHNTREQP
jgi:hypothetical protein